MKLNTIKLILSLIFIQTLNGVVIEYTSLFNNNINTAQEENVFKQLVLEASKQKIVVLKFSMPSCGPCILSKKQYESLSNQFKDLAIFYEVDITKFSWITANFNPNIMQVPTFIIYKDGNIKLRAKGLKGISDLQLAIQKLAN